MSSGFVRASAVALVALVLSPFMIVDAKPAAPPDTYMRAHALLRAAYPELSGQGLVFVVRGDKWLPYDRLPRPFLSMAITVRRQDLGNHDPVKPLLSVLIEFAENQTLSSFLADGAFIYGQKGAELSEWARDHEHAPDAQVVAKLKSLGARFHQTNDMREEVLRQSARIGTVLGRVQLEKLDLREDDPNCWVAEVFISTPEGRRPYSMLFEPFDGRLTAMGPG